MSSNPYVVRTDAFLGFLSESDLKDQKIAVEKLQVDCFCSGILQELQNKYLKLFPDTPENREKNGQLLCQFEAIQTLQVQFQKQEYNSLPKLKTAYTRLKEKVLKIRSTTTNVINRPQVYEQTEQASTDTGLPKTPLQASTDTGPPKKSLPSTRPAPLGESEEARRVRIELQEEETLLKNFKSEIQRVKLVNEEIQRTRAAESEKRQEELLKSATEALRDQEQRLNNSEILKRRKEELWALKKAQETHDAINSENNRKYNEMLQEEQKQREEIKKLYVVADSRKVSVSPEVQSPPITVKESSKAEQLQVVRKRLEQLQVQLEETQVDRVQSHALSAGQLDAKAPGPPAGLVLTNPFGGGSVEHRLANDQFQHSDKPAPPPPPPPAPPPPHADKSDPIAPAPPPKTGNTAPPSNEDLQEALARREAKKKANAEANKVDAKAPPPKPEALDLSGELKKRLGSVRVAVNGVNDSDPNVTGGVPQLSVNMMGQGAAASRYTVKTESGWTSGDD